jgi:hypothetical protein
MKSNKIKVVIGVTAIVVIAIVVSYITYNNQNHNVYTPDNSEIEELPYSSIGENGEITIEGDNVTSEETQILEYFAANGIQAGIIKSYVSDAGEADIPELVLQYDPEYFYYVNTSNETYVALFNDGELITDYEPVSE